MKNPYLPYPVRIEEISVETEDKNLKTFKYVFTNPEDEGKLFLYPRAVCRVGHRGKGRDPHRNSLFPNGKGVCEVYGEQGGACDQPIFII